MVDAGDLTLQYQLLCPSDGAVLKRFAQTDPLPIGEEVELGDCDPFTVRKRHILVAYVPTKKLLSGLLREADAGKASARFRARQLLVRTIREIGSRIHLPSNPTSTST